MYSMGEISLDAMRKLAGNKGGHTEGQHTETSDSTREHDWVVGLQILIMGVVLIVKDMGVLLVCNPLQSQDTSTQTDVSKSRVVLDNLPSSDSLGRRQIMRDSQVIPLMLRSSGLGWATREMGATFTMGGVLYLPWLVESLEECLGEGYWLLLNQRLPISFKLGDQLYGLLHHGQLVRNEEDVEGEIAEETVDKEVI